MTTDDTHIDGDDYTYESIDHGLTDKQKRLMEVVVGEYVVYVMEAWGSGMTAMGFTEWADTTSMDRPLKQGSGMSDDYTWDTWQQAAHLGLAFDAPHGTGKTRPTTEVIENAELRARIAELEEVLDATPMGEIAFLCGRVPFDVSGTERYVWDVLDGWLSDLLSARAGGEQP